MLDTKGKLRASIHFQIENRLKGRPDAPLVADELTKKIIRLINEYHRVSETTQGGRDKTLD